MVTLATPRHAPEMIVLGYLILQICYNILTDSETYLNLRTSKQEPIKINVYLIV